MVLLCITTRWAVANRRSTELALSCLDELSTNLAQIGHTLQGRIVHHDKDSVYTGYAWLKRVLLKEAVIVSFAQHGAKDNPWIESFWGRFKIENRDALYACETMSQLQSMIADRVRYYNEVRRHSALDHSRPEEVLLAALTGDKSTPDP